MASPTYHDFTSLVPGITSPEMLSIVIGPILFGQDPFIYTSTADALKAHKVEINTDKINRLYYMSYQDDDVYVIARQRHGNVDVFVELTASDDDVRFLSRVLHLIFGLLPSIIYHPRYQIMSTNLFMKMGMM